MESKHKNMLIGVLLALVFVMAVGYAAFAQTLTINTTSTITSTWDIHMENNSTNTATTTPSSTMGTTPSGEIIVNEGGLQATVTASLVSPGDTVTFVIPIVNAGNINAKLNSVLLSSDDNLTISNNVATTSTGNIRYTVTNPSSTLNAGAKDSVKIVAEFVDKADGNKNAYNETASLKITINYVQA